MAFSDTTRYFPATDGGEDKPRRLETQVPIPFRYVGLQRWCGIIQPVTFNPQVTFDQPPPRKLHFESTIWEAESRSAWPEDHSSIRPEYRT